jgi:hypothetical protein
MMGPERCSPEELKRLAAQVVEKILGDESLSDYLAEQLGKRRPPAPPECPQRTLCCDKDHVCRSGTGGFWCTAPFQCSNGHTEELVSRY